MKLYNTLSRKKEIFKPFDAAPFEGLSRPLRASRRQGKPVKLFVCGPTVYDSSHIGHARTYLVFDMLVKYLKEKGSDVFYLQNITDIDDKIIQRAKERKTTFLKLTRQYEKEYLKDMKALKIDSVTKYARATDYIKEIISQIKKLQQKGFAYQIQDGIYYDISKFKNYGKLSRRTIAQAEDGVSRIDEAKGKKNKGDFCLWKFSKKGEPSWRPAPSGRGSPSLPAGRPGWHIEDTAIAQKFFGTQYDIHGGGRDLMFPHHEAEIAQMEAISGKRPMVKYWLHSGFLTVNGKKMAKSLGNFITIKDFISQHGGRILRFMVLKAHYRSPIDYNEIAVTQAKRELERIDEFVGKLGRSDLPKTPGVSEKTPGVGTKKSDFAAAMEDDFNTPKAMAVIFELMRQRDFLNAKDALKFLKEIDRFFNFIFWPKPKQKIPADVLNLVKHRQKYREKGLWQKADEIRKEIQKLGWQIEDTKQGSKLKKLSS